MKKTQTTRNRIRTKIIAATLAAISVFSAGSLAVTTASAATTSAVQVQGAGSDGFFNGASTLISVISKSHPIAAIHPLVLQFVVG